MVEEGGNVGEPLFELLDPVRKRGQGRRDDEGALDVFLLEVRDERDDLDRLPKALSEKELTHKRDAAAKRRGGCRCRRTISSARMPERPFSYSVAIHLRPSSCWGARALVRVKR